MRIGSKLGCSLMLASLWLTGCGDNTSSEIKPAGNATLKSLPPPTSPGDAAAKPAPASKGTAGAGASSQ
jgi:hypothetical protein